MKKFVFLYKINKHKESYLIIWTEHVGEEMNRLGAAAFFVPIDRKLRFRNKRYWVTQTYIIFHSTTNCHTVDNQRNISLLEYACGGVVISGILNTHTPRSSSSLPPPPSPPSLSESNVSLFLWSFQILPHSLERSVGSRNRTWINDGLTTSLELVRVVRTIGTLRFSENLSHKRSVRALPEAIRTRQGLTGNPIIVVVVSAKHRLVCELWGEAR